MMLRLRSIVFAGALLALSACGFQLQGAKSFPPELQAVYLAVPDPNSDLAFQLRRSLTAAGVTLVRSEREATATVRISNERYGRRVKSVSAQNRPTEFEVFYEVEYLVSTPDEILVPRQPLARARIFPYSERDILGKQQEEELLRDALAREIAGVITRRLADPGN
jgi:LPS-assembly lipoprotein